MITRFVGPLALAAPLAVAAALQAQSADELIKNGDGCYAKLQAANALRFYLPAEKLEPNNERLLVHISREYRHLMSDATKPEEKRKLGGFAVDYAKRAVVKLSTYQQQLRQQLQTTSATDLASKPDIPTEAPKDLQ